MISTRLSTTAAPGRFRRPTLESLEDRLVLSGRRFLVSVPVLFAKLLRGSARRKGAPVRKPIQFRPALEGLEGRLTPAGNVTTSLVGGNLTIIDNAAASSLTISQPAANEITITPDAGTTINGKAGPVTIMGVTGGLNVNLGTGNDTLTFDLSHHSIAVGNVSITGSTGNKTVLTNTAGTTNALDVHGSFKEVFGNGAEFTRLDQFNVSGNMTIDHANGDAFVFLGVDPANLGTLFNRVGGALTVANVTSAGTTGSGSDVDALEETNVGGDVTAHMGTGNQSGFGGWTSVGSLSSKSVTVGGNVTITGHAFLAFGDFANDGEEVVNAHVAGNVTMNLGGGAGNTALFGGGASAGSTSANNVVILGSGAHDALTVGPSVVKNNLTVLLTGPGGNSISADSVSVTGDTTLMAAGGSNSIAIDNQAPGSTFGGLVGILTTGSNNLLEVNSHSQGAPGATTFDSPVLANLGAGNDTLVLAEAGKVDFKMASAFIGGTGTNHAFVNNNNIEGVEPTLVNFS
jgi:hypothetical protein